MKSQFIWIILSAVGVFIFSPNAQGGVGSFLLNTTLKITHPIPSVKNIAYGNESWQQLNVYPQKNNDNAPVLVFIYGGGWNKGSKEQYHFVADGLTRKGYLVVIADYLKYPKAQFPSFVEDMALTISWVKQNINRYGGNPEQLFLAGHSAGAHTGALLVTDKSYLAAVGLSVDAVKGFVGLSGPYNFTPTAPQYIKTFGQENFELMKVNNHVDGTEPPIKLIHGRGDKTVGQFNFDTFRNKLQANGHPVRTLLYDEDIGHVDTVLKTHPWFAGQVDVANEIDSFFKSILGL